MSHIARAAVTLFLAASTTLGATDFDADVQEATKKLRELLPAFNKQMDAGDFVGANATILATFPEANRTAAQSFLLGNVLFEVDRKQSYALHKAAMKLAPENPDVLWEWAIQQH